MTNPTHETDTDSFTVSRPEWMDEATWARIATATTELLDQLCIVATSNSTNNRDEESGR